jgi:hypothetical protein
MLKAILGWFSPVKLYASLAAAAVVLAVLAGLYMWGRNAGREAEAKRSAPVIAELRSDLASCKLTVTQQSDALKAQNDAITQLQTDAEQRAKAADEALRKAQQDARRYKDRAEQIARAKPKSDDLCKAADQLITETLSGERQ